MSKSKLYLLLTLALPLVFSKPAYSQQTIEIDTFIFKVGYFDELSEAFKTPMEVLYLDLSMRKFTEIPAALGDFENLIRLDLSYNKFTSLPPELGKLSKVTFFSLTGCYNMTSVPDELKNLSSLEELYLEDMLKSQAALVERIVAMFPDIKVVTGTRR
ncbi:MAG: leucine-rich repeat domain-containing protein [Bacteroidetes bacterium]|nr:leucine-rich repeat domain-containing protein [Bacteroidota bacterium]